MSPLIRAVGPSAVNRQRGEGHLPAVVGPRLAQAMRQLALYALPGDPYLYSWDWVNLAINTPTPVTRHVHQNTDFLGLCWLGSIGPNAQRDTVLFNEFQARIYTESDSRGLSTDAIRGDQFVGVPNNPGYMPAPWHVKANDDIVIELENIAAAARWIRLQLLGVRLYDKRPPAFKRTPYWYRINGQLAANAVRTQFTVQTQAVAPFAWIYTTGWTTGAMEITWEDEATGKTYQSLPIHDNALLVGNVQECLHWPFPISFQPNSTIQFYLTDLSGAPNNFEIILGGVHCHDLIGLEDDQVQTALIRAGAVG